MPATIECVGVPSGLTLTASLFPDGSDTAVDTGLACTEATNRKGLYTFSANRAGLHLIQLRSGSSVVWYGWALLATSGTIQASDERNTARIQFTVEGTVDANIQRVNDVEVVGTGVSGNEWGPA